MFVAPTTVTVVSQIERVCVRGVSVAKVHPLNPYLVMGGGRSPLLLNPKGWMMCRFRGTLLIRNIPSPLAPPRTLGIDLR